MSLVLNMVGGGGGGDTYAFVVAAYPAGSTCTCVKGGKTLTAKDTSGTWAFQIPEAGTWTVTSTDGTDTASTTVTISTEGQSESVELAYNIEFVKNGVLTSQPWTIAQGTSYPYAAITQETGDVLFTTGHSQQATVFGSTDAYDLTDYATLRLVVASGQSYYNANHAPCVAIGRNRPTGTGTSSSATNLDYKTMLNSSTGNITATTYTLDVSALSGLFYVGISIAGSSTMIAESGNGFVRVTDFGIYK